MLHFSRNRACRRQTRLCAPRRFSTSCTVRPPAESAANEELIRQARKSGSTPRGGHGCPGICRVSRTSPSIEAPHSRDEVVGVRRHAFRFLAHRRRPAGTPCRHRCSVLQKRREDIMDRRELLMAVAAPRRQRCPQSRPPPRRLSICAGPSSPLRSSRSAMSRSAKPLQDDRATRPPRRMRRSHRPRLSVQRQTIVDSASIF